MVIGLLKIELYLDGNRSLKGKRQIVKSLIDKIHSRFGNISISEVDSLDFWQKATIGISFVSNETPYVNSVLDKVLSFINSTGLVQITDQEFEIMHF